MCLFVNGLAVVVDGCFWHGCPQHYKSPVANSDFWKAKLLRNVSRDARVDADLVKPDWVVVRVWEHELRRNLAAAVARVVRVLQRRDRKLAVSKCCAATCG